MEYKIETSLHDFQAWSGGKDTLDVLIEKDVCDEVEEFIDQTLYETSEGTPNETQINDFLWFERDAIAEYLGYPDWEAFENGEESDDEGEEFCDINGTPIMIGDRVYWHDEAGEDNGEKIVFNVVELGSDGYFNLANDGEKFPERWAYYDEIEVIEDED